jgi:hypothetical protein
MTCGTNAKRWHRAGIVSDFPETFAEFGRELLTLLWRCGRDSFRGRDFHSRDDSRPNTLTHIEDPKWNVFDEFRLLEWKGGKESNSPKADVSLSNFLFAMKNHCNVPAWMFGLDSEMKCKAIYCDSSCDPCFWHIRVSWNCNVNTDSSIECFNMAYSNDTGLDRKTFSWVRRISKRLRK